MSDQDQKPQTLAGRQFDAVVAVAGVFSEQADRLFAETRAYQTTILRNQSVWFSKVIFARRMSDVIEAQSEHAKAQYEASVGEAKKFAEFLTGLARGAVASASAAAPTTTPAPVNPVANLVTIREREAA